MVYYAKTLIPGPDQHWQSDFLNVSRLLDPFDGQARRSFRSIRPTRLVRTYRIFVRYTGAWQPDTASGGFPGLLDDTQTNNYRCRGELVAHPLVSSSVLQLTFGAFQRSTTLCRLFRMRF